MPLTNYPSLAEITQLLQLYVKLRQQIKHLRDQYPDTSLRLPSFGELGESIVAHLLYEQKACDICKPATGDLQWDDQLCEIKTVTSKGPISFGPTEKWDLLAILDAQQFEQGRYQLYLISRTNQQLGYLKVNKKQTFADQIRQKRRPRICLSKLLAQIDSQHIQVIQKTWDIPVSVAGQLSQLTLDESTSMTSSDESLPEP